MSSKSLVSGNLEITRPPIRHERESGKNVQYLRIRKEYGRESVSIALIIQEVHIHKDVPLGLEGPGNISPTYNQLTETMKEPYIATTNKNKPRTIDAGSSRTSHCMGEFGRLKAELEYANKENTKPRQKKEIERIIIPKVSESFLLQPSSNAAGNNVNMARVAYWADTTNTLWSLLNPQEAQILSKKYIKLSTQVI